MRIRLETWISASVIRLRALARRSIPYARFGSSSDSRFGMSYSRTCCFSTSESAFLASEILSVDSPSPFHSDLRRAGGRWPE